MYVYTTSDHTLSYGFRREVYELRRGSWTVWRSNYQLHEASRVPTVTATKRGKEEGGQAEPGRDAFKYHIWHLCRRSLPVSRESGQASRHYGKVALGQCAPSQESELHAFPAGNPTLWIRQQHLFALAHVPAGRLTHWLASSSFPIDLKHIQVLGILPNWALCEFLL